MSRLGLGILSWRGYDSLRRSLTSWRDGGLFDLFDESLLFLPQVEPQGIEFAEAFGLPHRGSPDNLGILGGFKALATALEADVLVLAENDYVLVEPAQEAARQIARARRHVEEGSADVFRLRHRERPGETWHIDKAQRFWPAPGASLGARAAARLLRTARPRKARRLIGWTAFYDRDAPERWPGFVRRSDEGVMLISSKVLPWANNVFMIRRRFFLEVVLPAAEAKIGGRLINGFPSIETELNRGWWRSRDFWIGQDRGLFRHSRAGDRGY